MLCSARSDLEKHPSTCECKIWKEKIKYKVKTHIFEEDLLPGCPVRENLPSRHQHLFYKGDETNTNERNTNERSTNETNTNATNTNAPEGSWEHERTVQYNKAEEQRKKDERTFLYIGPNGTIISKLEFHTIHWDSVGAATRSLLTILFDNNVLATHTLSGKLSTVSQGKLKLPLCPKTVADIIYFVTKRFNCHECKVRTAITAKCAGVAQAQQRSKLLKNYLSNS
ncbi:protein insensitive [Zeugodacus cucurbitae]|uniref:protein insensitive n=1 Tax=Zeugodacus cucurbitae TaxID=28588 RepID=UPI0023D95A65|nr:protein insensitive [Zeugodacus cucurbitae]